MSSASQAFPYHHKIGYRTCSALAWLVVLCAYPTFLLAQHDKGAPNELVLKYVRPFGQEGIFTIVNGEQSGYLQARLRTQQPPSFGGGYVPLDIYANNLDPELSGRTHLVLGREELFAVQVKTEFSDPDGRRRKVKSAKVPRAGPGEQIGIGISIISISGLSARVGVQAEFYTDEGVLVGRTSWIDVDLHPGKRDAKSWTFRRRDLTEH